MEHHHHHCLSCGLPLAHLWEKQDLTADRQPPMTHPMVVHPVICNVCYMMPRTIRAPLTGNAAHPCRCAIGSRINEIHKE